VEYIFVKFQGLVVVQENLETQSTSNSNSGVHICQVPEPLLVQENLQTRSKSNESSGVHICQVPEPLLVQENL